MQRYIVITILLVMVLVSTRGATSAQMPPENVYLFAYSPASNLLAIDVRIPDAVDGRSQSIAEIYDAVSGEYLGFIPPQTTALIHMEFDAAGDRLTTVTVDSFVRTWDMVTFSRIQPGLPGGASEGGPIAWNPRYDRLAATSQRTIYISNGEDADAASFGDRETTDKPSDLEWSPDGTLLAVSTFDRRASLDHITIWEALGEDPMSAGPVLRIVGDRLYELDWSPDGTMIATSATDGIALYDAVTGEEVQRLQTGAESRLNYEVRWSPDGLQIASGIGNTLWIWDVETGALAASYTMPQVINDIEWLPNGQILHNGGEIGLAINGSVIEGYALPITDPSDLHLHLVSVVYRYTPGTHPCAAKQRALPTTALPDDPYRRVDYTIKEE